MVVADKAEKQATFQRHATSLAQEQARKQQLHDQNAVIVLKAQENLAALHAAQKHACAILDQQRTRALDLTDELNASHIARSEELKNLQERLARGREQYAVLLTELQSQKDQLDHARKEQVAAQQRLLALQGKSLTTAIAKYLC